jgi:hypothetical protein
VHHPNVSASNFFTANFTTTTTINSDWNHFKIIHKNMSTIPGNHEVKELQKTTLLGTAHILQKVLM